MCSALGVFERTESVTRCLVSLFWGLKWWGGGVFRILINSNSESSDNSGAEHNGKKAPNVEGNPPSFFLFVPFLCPLLLSFFLFALSATLSSLPSISSLLSASLFHLFPSSFLLRLLVPSRIVLSASARQNCISCLGAAGFRLHLLSGARGAYRP